ncbi:MAG: zinc-ribbon domain-containing protein, partial [Desulfobacterales bacterium]
MIITCEACDTSFNVDESLLASTGSKVRCSSCKQVFLAYPPDPADAVPDGGLPEDLPSDGDDTDELEFDMGIEIESGDDGDGDEEEAIASPELEIEGLEDPDSSADE